MPARSRSSAGGLGPSDRLRPGQIDSRRRRALARYIRHEVHPYSALNRRRLDDAGLGAAGVTGPEDLARLAPMALGDVASPADLVLRPTVDAIRRGGDLELRLRVWWGQLVGRGQWLNDHVIGPAFKPLQWTSAGGGLIGWSGDDLDRLAGLGRRWLAVFGLRSSDTLVTTLPPGPSLHFWQLCLGAREAGISAMHLGSAPTRKALTALGPTVVAGRLRDLLAVRGWPAEGIRTLLVLDGVPAEDARAELAGRSGGAVLASWAPAGARALWAECHPGSGLHTWPETEVVQLGDDGEIIWTPIGWRGSVLLRTATGARATLDRSGCAHCGRIAPRVHPAAVTAAG